MQNLIVFLQQSPDLAQSIGVIGFLIYISTFLSVQSGYLCGNGILFPVLQVTAASCVLTSLASAYNLASFLIQVSYITIGLFGISLRLRRTRGKSGKPITPLETASLQTPISFDTDCHTPCTFFRHTPDQRDAQKTTPLSLVDFKKTASE